MAIVVYQPTTGPVNSGEDDVRINGNNGNFDVEIGPKNLTDEIKTLNKQEETESPLLWALFIRKVCAIFLVQSLILFFVILQLPYSVYVSLADEEIYPERFWLVWIIIMLFHSAGTLLYRFMRQKYLSIVLLFLVSLSSGVLVWAIASRFAFRVTVLVGLGVLVFVYLGVILFTFQQKTAFTFQKLMIFVWILIVTGFLIVSVLRGSIFFDIVPVIFCNYISAATYLLMKDETIKIKPEEYVYGAVQILMYYVRLPCLVCKIFSDKQESA